jgi:hypothetical protein
MDAGSMIVEVQVRNNYGRAAVYPVSDLAKTLANLAGHVTLTEDDFRYIHKIPGVTVTVAAGPQGIPAWVQGS